MHNGYCLRIGVRFVKNDRLRYVMVFSLSVYTLAFTNFTDYEFQVVLSLSELEILQTILNNLSFPILIDSTSEISNIDATTGTV